jgi:hypothetical protein
MSQDAAPARTHPDPDFFIEGYVVRTGQIPGPEDPKSRRRVLQLVIRGRGWAVAGTPIIVHVGEVRVSVLAIEREGRDLVCLLNDVPPEGAAIVVRQWDRRAESPEPFTRRKLPKDVRPARARKRGR